MSAIRYSLALLLFSAAQAQASHDHRGGNCRDGRHCRTEVVSRQTTGPADYHATYAKITKTTVTIRNLRLRTEEGQVIAVATDPVTLDLQALSGFSQGIRLDLTAVEFPGGASTINLAEIEADVLSSPAAELQISGAANCALQAPKRLNFYTSSAITLGHDRYHVKVTYTALNSIQLDVVTTVTQTKCHGDVRDTRTAVAQKCKLVNRRQPIASIVLAVDDDF